MTYQRLLAEVVAQIRGRCPDIADAAVAAIEPCVRFDVRATDDRSASVGASRIGGSPDLPEEVDWPTWTPPHRGRRLRGYGERPLRFIAQFDLAVLPTTEGMAALPRSGLLSVFVDDEVATGLYPEDRPGFRLFHTPAGAVLRRRQAPSGVEALRAGLLAPRLAPSLATNGLLDESEDVPDEQVEELWEVEHELDARLGLPAGHQVLGHGRPIQNPVEVEAMGGMLDLYRSTPIPPERWEEAERRSRELRLLLQVDSDDDLGIMWGDVGTLYWTIEREALPDLDLTRTWYVFQCH